MFIITDDVVIIKDVLVLTLSREIFNQGVSALSSSIINPLWSPDTGGGGGGG